MTQNKSSEETSPNEELQAENIASPADELSRKMAPRRQMGIIKKLMNPSALFVRSVDSPFVVEGNILLKKKRLEEALDAFQAAVNENANCIEGYLGIGKTLNLLGGVSNTKKSIKYFNQALKIDATRLDIYNDTISVYERLGDKKNAAAERKKRFIARTLKSNPYDSKANNNMGVIQLQQKNIDAAIRSFNKAIRSSKDFVTAKMNLANAYLHKALTMETELDRKPFLNQANDLVDFVLLKENTAAAHLLKAKILLHAGNLKAATTACNTAISKDPSLKEAFNTKQVIEERMGNIRNASQAFESYQSLTRQEQKKPRKNLTSPFE